MTYHDACRMGRLGDKLYDTPRELIKQIPGVILFEMEKEYILKAMEMAHGSKQKAADLLGITLDSIKYRIKKLKM